MDCAVAAMGSPLPTFQSRIYPTNKFTLRNSGSTLHPPPLKKKKKKEEEEEEERKINK